MKPILFSTEMVRAIMRKENPKSQTRRVIKPQPDSPIYRLPGQTEYFFGRCKENNYQDTMIKSRYKAGDILWVREVWTLVQQFSLLRHELEFRDGERITFKFDNSNRSEKWCKYYKKNGWQSPYFMPHEAARIFLKVTDVWAERLQNISDVDARAEGCPPCIGIANCGGCDGRCEYMMPREWYSRFWDYLHSAPKPVYAKINGIKTIIRYESYPWEDIREIREYRGKPWIVCGNPMVFALKFKNITDRKRG